jgi:hypothetical protein
MVLYNAMMLCFASVLIGFATIAAAPQVPEPEMQRALDSLSSLGAALGAPDLQPSQAFTIGSAGHARAYIERLDFPKAMNAGVQLRRTQVLAQVTSTGSQLPAAAKAALGRDVTAAFDAAATHYMNEQLGFATLWFAQRLTHDELQAGIEFFSQELGEKMATNAAGLTPADREAIGRYVMNHPAMTRVTAANIQFSRDALARRAATAALFDADFKRTLCLRVAADKIELPSCAIKGSQ